MRCSTNLVPALFLSTTLLTACGGEGSGSTVGYESGATFTTQTDTQADSAADGSTADETDATASDATTGSGDDSDSATTSTDGTTTGGDGDSATTDATATAGDGDSSTTDATATAGDGDGDSSGTDSTGTDTSGTTTSTTGTTGTTGGEMGCEGIDFLFVIDNSGSMGDEQAALIASFDGFIDSIDAQLQTLGADSYNIMVTDTDAAEVELDPFCLTLCTGNNFTGTCLTTGDPCELYNPACVLGCQLNPSGQCSGYDCDILAGCDDQCDCELGAGIVTTPGGGSCNVTGGNLYMQENQADPKAAFSCMANVGTSGSGSERQMEAMVQALSPALNNTGGCNANFVRPNSILVVTVITDEEDSNSAGDPSSWANAVLAAKNNDQAGIVVLGLIGDNDQPMPVCGSLSNDTGAEAAPNIRQFVNSFDNGVTGSVCAPSYNQFFADAVSLIEDTCISFPIPE